MPSLTEIVRALYGAYRLARVDPGGLQYFDTSIGGFWRSFFAAVLIAPLYFALLQQQFDLGGGSSPTRYLTIQAIAYVIAWFLFPLAMVTVCRALDRERHYLRFIVAYNWASVLQNAVYLPVGILIQSGIVPPDAGALAMVFLLTAILAYTWYVARTALDIAGLAAVGVVFLDFFLGILVQWFADSLV